MVHRGGGGGQRYVVDESGGGEIWVTPSCLPLGFGRLSGNGRTGVQGRTVGRGAGIRIKISRLAICRGLRIGDGDRSKSQD